MSVRVRLHQGRWGVFVDGALAAEAHSRMDAEVLAEQLRREVESELIDNLSYD